jgi:hypothetical protein
MHLNAQQMSIQQVVYYPYDYTIQQDHFNL